MGEAGVKVKGLEWRHKRGKQADRQTDKKARGARRAREGT